MNKTICVYSSSSCTIDNVYFEVARELGRKIAESGDAMIYGGGLVGLMGASAKAVHEHGGRVVGVIPKALNIKGIVYETCDELIITEGMRERKAVMDMRANAFIALPGGFGTVEELLEIITLKQLHYHNKPIVILNINGFYDKLIEQFDMFVEQRFAKAECRKLYFVTDNASAAMEHIDSYVPQQYGDKWLTDVEK